MYKYFNLTNFLITFAINSSIAVLLTLTGGDFVINFIFSQCIGYSIHLLVSTALTLTQNHTQWIRVTLMILSIAVGASLGTVMGSLLLGFEPLSFSPGEEHRRASPILIGVFFGIIVTYYFGSRYRLLKLRAETEEHKRRQLEQEQQILQSEVKLMQAQIEPHFLFNTLANISSLINTNPAGAKQMLDALNRYLRISLNRTRDGDTTLGEEIELIDTYLSIMKTRIGERFTYNISLDESTKSIPFPPLLIQPLVENAITHGLEQKSGLIQLNVSVNRGANDVEIMVEDNGIGLHGNIREGIGLSNARKRIKSYFGPTAQFAIKQNAQGGVTSAIIFPFTTKGPST